MRLLFFGFFLQLLAYRLGAQTYESYFKNINVAEAYFSNSKYDSAEIYFSKAFSISKEISFYNYEYATTKFRLGRYEQSASVLYSIADKGESLDEYMEWAGLFNTLGRSEIGKLKEKIKEFDLKYNSRKTKAIKNFNYEYDQILVAIFNNDQTARKVLQPVMIQNSTVASVASAIKKEIYAVDSVNLSLLKNSLIKFGYPKPGLVSSLALQGFYISILHSYTYKEAKPYLDSLLTDLKIHMKQFPVIIPNNYANIFDRDLLNTLNKTYYGVIYPEDAELFDSLEAVNERRKEIFLPILQARKQ